MAREESARIVAAARVEAQAIEEEAARADEAELALITEQQLAQARAAATAALRAAREELFGAWFSELRARVAGLRSNARYRSVMRSLVLESIAALPAATLLRVDPRDEALVSEITAELGLAIEVSPSSRCWVASRSRAPTAAPCGTRSRSAWRTPSRR